MNGIAKAVLVIAVGLLVAARSVAAQRASDIRAGIAPIAQAASQPDFSAIEAEIKESYWKEGAIIGTILVATPTAIFAVGISDGDLSVPAGIAIGLLSGALTGGVLGALIGGQVAKEP